MFQPVKNNQYKGQLPMTVDGFGGGWLWVRNDDIMINTNPIQAGDIRATLFVRYSNSDHSQIKEHILEIWKDHTVDISPLNSK